MYPFSVFHLSKPFTSHSMRIGTTGWLMLGAQCSRFRQRGNGRVQLLLKGMLNIQWFHFGLVQKLSWHHWIMLLPIMILLLCGEMFGNGTTVGREILHKWRKWCNEITVHCQTCCLQMGFAMEIVVSVECLWCCNKLWWIGALKLKTLFLWTLMEAQWLKNKLAQLNWVALLLQVVEWQPKDPNWHQHDSMALW